MITIAGVFTSRGGRRKEQRRLPSLVGGQGPDSGLHHHHICFELHSLICTHLSASTLDTGVHPAYLALLEVPITIKLDILTLQRCHTSIPLTCCCLNRDVY